MKQFAFVMLAVTLVTGVPAAQDLERLFKAAVNTETVDVNCKAAIEQYRKVAAGSNRPLAAQALLRMAGCYEQLGDSQAARIYERIVSDYANQTEVAAQARARLTAMAPQPPRGDRMVSTGSQSWGRVSPDGRLIPYIDYNVVPPTFHIQDLVAGTTRKIDGCMSASAFSPDGKQLVCGGSAISIVNLEGPPRLRQIYKNEDVEFFYPTDWSADGSLIAVTTRRKDRTRQMAVVRVSDGSFSVLRTFGWSEPDAIVVSPDGKYVAYDLPAGDNEPQKDVFVMAVDGSGEWVVVRDPSNDFPFAWTPEGSLLFTSSRSGGLGLYNLPMQGGKPTGIAPSLLKANIVASGLHGLTRSGALYVLRETNTTSIQVSPIDLTQGRLTGPPIAQIYRADTPTWSPDGSRLAYAHRKPDGGLVLAIRTLDSGLVQEIQPRLLYMPMPTWMPDGRSVVTWGRDVNGKGVIVRIDAETGQQAHVVDAYDIQQAQVSPDGTKLYHSDDNNRGAAATNRGAFERDLTTGAVRTLVYAGRLSPDGQMVATVIVDEKSRTSMVAVAPPHGGEVRRVTVPVTGDCCRGFTWTHDSKGLLVADVDDQKKSRSLWLVPITGEPARRLDIDVSTWIVIQGFRLSPDGKRIAFFTGGGTRELWALENVVPAAGKR